MPLTLPRHTSLPTSTHTQADPLPSSISPLRFYPIPTAAARHTTVQDAAAQTFPPSVSIMANPLQPLLLHKSQQTTPRPHTHHRHIQTDIHAIVQLPSFAGIMPTPEANQPDSSLPTTSMAPTASPNPTSAANKQPHDQWSTSFPLPQLPFRNNHTHHRHFLPPSGAHRATAAPRHLHAQPPPPALGSRTHAPVPPLHTARHQPQLHSHTKLQSTLCQNDLRHHFIKPNNLPPPLNRCSPSLRLLAGHVSKEDHTLRPHQRHRHRPQPHLRTPGQHISKSQHNSNIPPSQHR